MRKIKIERINNKQKLLLINTIIIIGIVVTLVLITSKAKYKNVQSIDLASGIINYTPVDIDIVAINIENDAGEYDSVDTIPTSGYVLSDTSYCNVNGEKDTSIKLSYKNGSIEINDISKKTKCYLYFDKYSAIDTIIGDTTSIQEKTSFTGIATSTDTGIYSAPDDYGTSYYFRGVENQLNNWVKFAGFYWRIIRINGNGTVRMIYSGEANGAILNSNKTGSTTQINELTYKYNSAYDDNTYVGYMNGASRANSYSLAHQNKSNSNAKSILESWYINNIRNIEGYYKHIDVNTGFCNDRGISKISRSGYSNLGYGINNNTAYADTDRTVDTNWNKLSTQTPIFQCINRERDLFTYKEAIDGNKKLEYSVGMITMDEVIFAGGFSGMKDSTFYLYTNSGYWTMTPHRYYNGCSSMIIVGTDGLVGSGVVQAETIGLRPVINLRADTEFTGDGSETNPFVVI